MLIIPIKENEPIERALKKFKKKFERTGAIPEQVVIMIAVRDVFEVQVFKKSMDELDTYIDKLIDMMKKQPQVIQIG